jgi:anti-sigma B factor antagonist
VEIKSDESDGRAVITLTGDLDVHASSAVEAALAAALASSGGVTIDLSAVPFADSSGLGTLIAAYKKAQGLGKEIRLRKPTPIVAEILTITRMKRFFPIEE